MSGVFKQFFATFSCNLLSASYGSTAIWGAPNYLIFTSKELSPFESGPISKEAASLVTAIPNFGAIIGTIFFSAVIEKYSRKLLLLSIAIVQILSWTAILLAPNVYYVYVARMASGFAGSGAFVIIPVFVSEIAADNVRGALGSMLILVTNAGCVFGFFITGFLDYFGQIKANILVPILFLLLFYLFPETPEFLLKQNKKNAAKKSQRYYHGNEVISQLDETEKLNEVEKSGQKQDNAEGNSDSRLSFSDFTSKPAVKAIMIALYLGALNQFCGAFTLMNYANKIFQDSNTTLSEYACSLIVAIVQSVANCITMLLVDRAGRKVLVAISAFGCFLSLASMGLYDQFQVHLIEFNWIPLVAFSGLIFMSSMGILPLTFVLLSEILPKKIKSIVTLLALEVIFGLAFLLTSYYTTLTELIGAYNVYFMFAGCSIVGAIICVCFLPETKGKTYDTIMKELAK